MVSWIFRQFSVEKENPFYELQFIIIFLEYSFGSLVVIRHAHTLAAYRAIQVNSFEKWHYRVNLIFDPKFCVEARAFFPLFPIPWCVSFNLKSILVLLLRIIENQFSLAKPKDFYTFRLISHSKSLAFMWQTPAERMKRINPRIGSFVCYSINCTYQILSAFICLPAPIVAQKDQLGQIH